MRIAVVGSRDFSRLDKVIDYVNSLPEGTIVVTGDARGVDTAAKNAAEARGLKVDQYKAKWNLYGKRAGPLRNIDIEFNSDQCAAFWDLKSSGTLDTISLFRKSNKPVEIILEDT